MEMLYQHLYSKLFINGLMVLACISAALSFYFYCFKHSYRRKLIGILCLLPYALIIILYSFYAPYGYYEGVKVLRLSTPFFLPCTLLYLTLVILLILKTNKDDYTTKQQCFYIVSYWLLPTLFLAGAGFVNIGVSPLGLVMIR